MCTSDKMNQDSVDDIGKASTLLQGKLNHEDKISSLAFILIQ